MTLDSRYIVTGSKIQSNRAGMATAGGILKMLPPLIQHLKPVSRRTQHLSFGLMANIPTVIA
jgi:hypothetical protein